MKNCSSKLWAAAAGLFLVACGGGGDSSGGSSPLPVPDTVTAFFAAFDASRATSISPTGAGFFAMYDGCYVDNGRSKAGAVADFDADPQSVDASKVRIGSTRNHLQVIADRSSTNADGTSRREIDIKYDINFTDGTVDGRSIGTLIFGSSTGSTLPDGSTCATPENRQAWRFYGNRRVVATSVTARNDRLERYALADGAALTEAVQYSKYIVLTVEDPGGYATYATVSGPGLSFDGIAPATLKMLSPRLLRDDPLLAGKKGNYVDAKNNASFSGCRTPTVQNRDNYADAAVADCATNGASGSAWGAFNYAAPADADAGFDNHGVVAGGVYTFKIYNDDGWKTINGQAGKTPIATYTETLKHLPYSASAMAGVGVNADLFPRFTTLSKSKTEIAAAIRQKAAISVAATWSAAGALPDGGKLGWGSVYAYETGRANALAAGFPASRNTTVAFPATGATQATLPSPTPGALLVDLTYSEMGLYYLSHDGNAVSSIFSFQ